MIKKRALCIFLVFFAASLFCADNVFAGAWTVPKYKVWSEYYTRWSYGKDAYNSDWKLQSTQSTGAKNFRVRDFTQEPKFEYGVTDWLTALASVQFESTIYKEYQRPNYGIYYQEGYTVKNRACNAVRIGGRWRIIDVPFVLSTQTKVSIYPRYGINRGDTANKGPLLGAYQDLENSPSLGYGNDSLEQRILIGKAFFVPLTKTYKLPCYGGAEAGYVWNNRTVANGYVWFLEGGFWPFPWLLVKSELDAYKSQDGTGKFEKAYGIWRIGGAWQVFGGDSVLRQGSKLFNLEFDYGLTIWGKNTTAYQEFIFKMDTQF
jgi:hypothetical protein